MASAILDLFLRHANIHELEGKSYGVKDFINQVMRPGILMAMVHFSCELTPIQAIAIHHHHPKKTTAPDLRTIIYKFFLPIISFLTPCLQLNSVS